MSVQILGKYDHKRAAVVGVAVIFMAFDLSFEDIHLLPAAKS